MKIRNKTLTLFCLIGLLAAFPVCAKDMPAAGGWTVTEEAEVPQEAAKALEQALEASGNNRVEPVALLGQQVVAGINYCILCRVTDHIPDARPEYSLAYVYAGVDGTCDLLGMCDLDISENYSLLMTEKRETAE